MRKPKPTPQAKDLFERLNENGIDAQLEYWDGYKHVDIGILEARLYIEIDGNQHFINPKQLKTDIARDHFSDREGFGTIRIPRMVYDQMPEQIAQAIIKIATEERERIKVFFDSAMNHPDPKPQR